MFRADEALQLPAARSVRQASVADQPLHRRVPGGPLKGEDTTLKRSDRRTLRHPGQIGRYYLFALRLRRVAPWTDSTPAPTSVQGTAERPRATRLIPALDQLTVGWNVVRYGPVTGPRRYVASVP